MAGVEGIGLVTPKNPGASPQFNRAPSRGSRRHRKPGDRALWQIGVAAAPPIATIGLALAVFGFLQPAIAVVPLLRSASYLVILLCAASLGLILFNVRPGSTRLRMAKVWVAMVLALLTIPALLIVDHRARRVAGEYQAPSVGPNNMDSPPSER
jgi:hypothetical protein